MTEEKNDLSSLITLPIETPAEGEKPPQPIQFESLEELTGTDPATEPAEVVEPAAAPEPVEALDTIRTYSETAVQQSSQVAASFPFTLKIEGPITAEDGEKILSILNRENMGFREVDLEPQIAEGKILIPRISEYAGVLLIQALRGIQAKIFFGPSDEIFSTPETRDDFPAILPPISSARGSDRDSSAELPVSTSDALPQFQSIEVLDAVIVSGLLTTSSVEAASSREYDQLCEALVRELKFKAKRRGANGIVSLQIMLTPLTLPTDYRVTIGGSAVRGT